MTDVFTERMMERGLRFLIENNIQITKEAERADRDAWVIELFESGKSNIEIADKVGCSPSNVQHILKRAGKK